VGKVAAIDFGLKRIGIALSDERKVIALPFETVEGGKSAVQNVAKALKGQKIDKVIVGLPLLLNGKKGDMAILVERFAIELEKELLSPVALFDERLSSKGAEQRLREMPMSRKERAKRLDSTAAAILLQSYLEMQ
jgi:putative Holliday junction resolvase